jgi:hypothetical protein
MSPRPPATSRSATLASGGASGGAWRGGWLLLGTLLAALVLATVLHDRTTWPTLVGDEATYLMQAESLAFDLDLVYGADDYERFVRHWGRAPEGVILQKGTGSDALVYGKPFFYAAWAAPFTRLSPTRGPFVANAVLLALAALVSARSLRGGLGAAAPVWVALFVFASVTFAHVFWAHMDLFLACCTALGMALLFGPRGDEASSTLRALLPFAAAGVLLAMVAYSRPLYATLLLPAGIAAWSATRRGKETGRRAGAVGVAWTVGGAVLLALLALGVHESLAGSWTSYGAERRSFNSTVGFPGVDVPAESWEEMIREWGNASWLKRRDLGTLGSVASFRLWAWNTVYFLFGRSVGLAPYFAPALLAVLAFLLTRRRRAGDSPERGPRADRGDRWARWALLAAVAATAAGFLVIRPFNFYGGGGALANRYFLPVYPALWFLVSGPSPLGSDRLRRALRRFGPVATALLAAPFLWPVWSAPLAYPVDGDGVFRYVSRAAVRWLPFESTQNHLKPGGPVPEYLHQGLWVKLLDPDLDAVAVDGAEGGAFLLRGGEPASLLVGSERPLTVLELAGRPGLPPLRVDGGEVDGSGSRRPIELDDPVAVHPMWWTREDFYLYELTLEPDRDPDVGGGGDFGFTLRPVDPGGPR